MNTPTNAAGRAPLSDINVTPLVDVMLVLLVIFMVAAPLLEQGIQVSLPEAGTGKALASQGINISLSKEHVVYLNREIVTMKELRQKLSGMAHGQPVLIRADESAYVSRLVALWDLCREVGFPEIRIVTLSE